MKQKQYGLCGLGNAIVDIFVEVTDKEFAELGYERGTMRLVDLADQQTLLKRFHAREPRLVSGGSVANSVIAYSQLGGRGAFIGCVADDRYGLFYATEFEELNIDIGNPVIIGEATGTCVAVITPDAERTMRTCLAVSSHLAARHVDEERIRNSEWLFIEGYVFANPDTGQGAIRKAISLAKAHGTKVALTCSEAFVVEVFGGPFHEEGSNRRGGHVRRRIPVWHHARCRGRDRRPAGLFFGDESHHPSRCPSPSRDETILGRGVTMVAGAALAWNFASRYNERKC